MRYYIKAIMALVALLALASTSIVGCGESGPTETKTIKIGFIADLTGPASSFMRAGSYPAWEDAIRYANENDPVANNVKVEIAFYDGKMDATLDIQAYDYLREQGCVLLTSPFSAGETLKSTVDQEEVFFLSTIASKTQTDPPGWVFCVPNLGSPLVEACLSWIAENDWDYTAKGRKPKVGAVGQDDSYVADLQARITAYCQAHPDQFELGPLRKTPGMSFDYSAEVGVLKDCDYILPPTNYVAAFFIEQYRNAGYTNAKFFGPDGLSAYLGLIVGQLGGWSGIDGTVVAHQCLWLSDTSEPFVQEMLDRIDEYRPADKSVILSDGKLGYAANYPNAKLALALLRAALKKVDGDPDKLTQQVLYDTAVELSVDVGMGIELGWSDTSRIATHDVRLYKWDAATQDLTVLSGWVPE